MKNKISKLLAVLFVLICFAVPVFVGDMKTEAADTTSIIETYTADAASTYFKNNTAPTCKTDGYIFAGWYAEDDIVEVDETTGEEYFTGNPVVTLVGYMHENVKALFVEKSVLDVKGQIAILDNEDGTADDGNINVATVTDTTKANLRLVTSVDSLKYQKVGFEISYTYGETPVSTGSVTNYVYKNLTVVDGTDGAADEKMVPSEVFSKRSQYFKACTVNGVPKDAFDTDFSVRAYWVTADGAKVYGSSTALNKSVQAGIYHTYEAGVDTTYYKVLEDAVGSVAASETEATVTLFKDAEVEGKMSITGQVNITNRQGENVKLTRGNGLSSANMFSVSSTGTIKINGTTDESSIVLDGSNLSSSVPLLFSDGGIINVENATFQKVTCTHASQGGAIQASKGEVYLTKTKFLENISKYGGALRSSGTTIIAKCTFGAEGKGNEASGDGGAICVATGGSVTITDSVFEENTASARGGAIYNGATNAVASTLVVKNSKFIKNVSSGTGGGAICQAGSKASLTLEAENDDLDDTLAVFQNNVAESTDASSGGGAVLIANGTFKITGYEFKENSAKVLGGAICIKYIDGTIDNVTFDGNYTEGANGYGGAVYLSTNTKGTTEITDTTFRGNYTKGNASHGGALYVAAKGGGHTIDNTKFENNHTDGSEAYGGAIYLVAAASSTSIIDSYYSGNYIIIDGVTQEDNVYIAE